MNIPSRRRFYVTDAKSLILLYALVFISYASISMPYPIFAPTFLLNKSYALSTNNHYNVIFLGLLLASYPFGQLIGAPFTGFLSDKFNRKNLLIVTSLGAGIAYLGTGLSLHFHNISLVFILRFFTGFFESNIVIVQTLISDHDESYSGKVKNFSCFYVMCTLGFVVGPLLGGLGTGPFMISFFGISTPFIASAFLIFLLAVLTQFFLKPSESHLSSPIQNTQSMNTSVYDTKLKNIILFNVICFLGIDTFLSFSPVYLVQRWGFPVNNLMLYSMYLAVLLASAQGVFVPFFLKYFQPYKVLFLSLFLISFLLGSISLLYPSLEEFLFFLPFIALSISSITTSLTLIILNKSEKQNQGKSFGLLRVSRAAGDAIVCTCGGMLASVSSALPMALAALLFLIVLIFLYLLIFHRMGVSFNESSH